MENSLDLAKTTLSDDEAAKLALERSRLQATANLMFAQEEMGRRILEPTLSTKTLLDMAEHAYKVSGMAAKQKEAENAGPGFSITINIPQVGESAGRVITVGPQPADPIHTVSAEAETLLASLPKFISSDTEGNLSDFID